MREGNERVVRPRLADAEFFWESDRRTTLASREAALREVVYQRGLGSLYDKSRRTGALGQWLARDARCRRRARRARRVARQVRPRDRHGRRVSRAAGHHGPLLRALRRRAGERFAARSASSTSRASPATACRATPLGQILAVADKLDTLAGVFSIGKKPSGNRDPFGLRRAALGVVRILIECGLDIDLKALIAEAVRRSRRASSTRSSSAEELYAFIGDRLRRYFLDREEGSRPRRSTPSWCGSPRHWSTSTGGSPPCRPLPGSNRPRAWRRPTSASPTSCRQAGDPEGLTVKKKL